jgi:hypothetical protein
MLTFFTTAKPFRGHNGVIQLNALRSWKLLHPDVEVILFGDEEGAAEVSVELGLRHEPHVERNEIGLKRIDYYFDRAQEIARHDVLCYVNCDIILMQDFCRAVERVRSLPSEFLMIGRRWDVEIRELVDFSKPNWRQEIRQRAITANQQRDERWIDYFAFSRGLYYKRVPAFVIGRIVWDNWLLWCAANLGATVVDASDAIQAVHQCHDYSYHPAGEEGVWTDEYAQRNLQLAGGWDHAWFIGYASWILCADGTLRHRRRLRYPNWLIYDVWLPSWHFVLDITRPVRTILCLRSKNSR